jgi:RNA-splicing ligase RtcB
MQAMAKGKSAEDGHDVELSIRDLVQLVDVGRIKVDKEITVELSDTESDFEDLRKLRDVVIDAIDSEVDEMVGGADDVEDEPEDEDEVVAEGEPDEEDEDSIDDEDDEEGEDDEEDEDEEDPEP